MSSFMSSLLITSSHCSVSDRLRDIVVGSSDGYIAVVFKLILSFFATESCAPTNVAPITAIGQLYLVRGT